MNITETARKVLDDELEWASLDPGHHPEGRRAVYRMARSAPDLARAVLAIAELADGYIERYDRHPYIEGDYPQRVVVTAKAIRAILNGGGQ